MRKFTKVRPKTEIQEFHDIPNIKKKTFKLEAMPSGNIIFVESDDPQIMAFLISKGFS